MIYLRLFFEFFKTGLFAIGGGLATIPFLQEIAETTGWFTRTDLINMIAVSESTPGPIGINMATYVGNTVAGPLGSLVAVFGLVLPSFVIITIIFSVLTRFKESSLVKLIFKLIRPVSVALISISLIGVFYETFFLQEMTAETNIMLNYKTLILGIILFILTRFKKIKSLHPIVIILFTALIGVIFKF